MCFGNEDREPFDVVERAIAMLESLDPAGDGFRYATTRAGGSSMMEDVYLDPQALLRLIREVDEVLGAASMAFQAQAEAIQYAYQQQAQAIQDAYQEQAEATIRDSL
jgi:hypothetical protein